MASYTNGFNTFGGDMARFLQASASNGHQPNGTGQFGGNTNRNGHGRVNRNQNSPRGNRRRGGNAGGQRPNQQPRRSPNTSNHPNGANTHKRGNNPRRQGNSPNNTQPRQNAAPRHPGNNNNNRRRAQQLRAAFTRTRDGDVVMRDAFVAPITAPAEEDRDAVMTDAPPLPETRVECFTQGALAMNWIATAMLNLAVNDEAQGSTPTHLQTGGAPFYF